MELGLHCKQQICTQDIIQDISIHSGNALYNSE